MRVAMHKGIRLYGKGKEVSQERGGWCGEGASSNFSSSTTLLMPMSTPRVSSKVHNPICKQIFCGDASDSSKSIIVYLYCATTALHSWLTTSITTAKTLPNRSFQ
ncbi:unnamed protein product, partial [Vitis vinifera]